MLILGIILVVFSSFLHSWYGANLRQGLFEASQLFEDHGKKILILTIVMLITGVALTFLSAGPYPAFLAVFAYFFLLPLLCYPLLRAARLIPPLHDHSKTTTAAPLEQGTLNPGNGNRVNNLVVAKNLLDQVAVRPPQSQYTQAKSLYKLSIDINEKALGSDAPALTESIAGQASLYYLQGNYAQAASLYERALAIGEKAFGPEHPEVAPILHNLALVSFDLGDIPRAEGLLKRVLSIYMNGIGLFHPIVGSCYQCLGMINQFMGPYDAVLPSFLMALQIYEKTLGPSDPRVVAVLKALAVLYRANNQDEVAEKYEKRAKYILSTI